MSSPSQRSLTNGDQPGRTEAEVDDWNAQLLEAVYLSAFHGDALIGDKRRADGFMDKLRNRLDDVRRIVTPANMPSIIKVLGKMLAGGGLDMKAGSRLIGSMSNDSNARKAFMEKQVQIKYERMLHPPLTYLGDAFKFRTADGRFNNALQPHLGQAGAPYAKTVPSKTHPLGALPDAGDLFDRLMARQENGRPSTSGLSSMLIYHATIIIHDIFRTNNSDKNISDTSSYLDLSPLYGFTEEMQREVRDDKYKLGLLKPDTFAEDRLLRQPPGVCIMLVMYNRYHNYCATQLRRINENGKFSVPKKFELPKLAAAAKFFVKSQDPQFSKALDTYVGVWKDNFASDGKSMVQELADATRALQDWLGEVRVKPEELSRFNDAWEEAWNKLDDDLFNTARLITCGMYIQISIHDYLRALMGFHKYGTNFTLDPRTDINNHTVTRGIGNQVTVEFNLLYRFHCAISIRDEAYTEDFMREGFAELKDAPQDPKKATMADLRDLMTLSYKEGKVHPSKQIFGLKHKSEQCFARDPTTMLFNDQQMVNELIRAMDDPISNFGPRNVPQCLKQVEILGILQARKWEIGTLNDFREFFGMKRHQTFESITENKEVQNALRDLYEHPDKVELYPGVFCESSKDMDADPGPSDLDSALWAAIFSDAITLVRSDRFYTVDWNTNSLTTWGMKEVTPDSDVLKGSVFHRLLQRAFPEWFPYDSIRFFHPFYTGKKNAILAKEQGYAGDFRMLELAAAKGPDFDILASNPNRPMEPLILRDIKSIKALFEDKSDKIVHPSRLNLAYLPKEIAAVLAPRNKSAVADDGQNDSIQGSTTHMMEYFVDLLRGIIKRQAIAMNPSKDAPVFQIDVVKNLAIPAVTRYVADFLGISNLVRSETNPGAKYSENEIYQHITNCQVFLSYNIDETKLLKRRQAFKSSASFLFELAKKGNVYEATRWPIPRWLSGKLQGLWHLGRQKQNPMTQLGFKVAQQVYANDGDAGETAAIMLLIALDSAYNSVLASVSVLDMFLRDLYDYGLNSDRSRTCDWLKVQELAFSDDVESVKELEKLVLKTQRASVRLPVIAKAVERCAVKEVKYGEENTLFTAEKGQTVICDIFAAENAARKPKPGGVSGQSISGSSTPDTDVSVDVSDFLAYRWSFADKFATFHPKELAALHLTAMVKVLAQTKNLRRGHDAQGRLKRVNMDASYEAYSNYIAPLRMREIQLKTGRTFREHKPPSQTYLTPEWDELIPWPATWKVRFDGFGRSTYVDDGFAKLRKDPFPDDMPPWYQPRGPSRTGGSFGTLASSSSPPSDATMPSAVVHPPGTPGCGFPGPSMNGKA